MGQPWVKQLPQCLFGQPTVSREEVVRRKEKSHKLIGSISEQPTLHMQSEFIAILSIR